MSHLKLFGGESSPQEQEVDPVATVISMQRALAMEEHNDVPAVVRFNATPETADELAQILQFERQRMGLKMRTKMKPATRQEPNLED